MPPATVGGRLGVAAENTTWEAGLPRLAATFSKELEAALVHNFKISPCIEDQN